MKNIKTKIVVYKHYLASMLKSIIFSIIYLKFMKNNKVQISVFNRYLILLIVLLFSYLFYLSIPALYNYEVLQKDLTRILKEEFKLNAALSGNINYKILPTPNFEVFDVALSTDSENKFEKFVQIKKMKIYVSISELYNQKNLKINKVILSESNFDINPDSFKYIKKFLKKKNSVNNIEIKKSKLFFKDKKKNKDAIAISTINKSNIFYDKKNNSNKMNIEGSIFNSKFNFYFLKRFEDINKTFTEIDFKKINTKIKNEISKNDGDENYKGKVLATFLGSEVKINYDIVNNAISISSNKSTVAGKKINLDGKINKSPFYFDLNIELESIDGVKFVENFFELRSLFRKSIFLNEKFNGEVLLNINFLKNFQFFDQAKINLHFFNGEFFLDETSFIANKIGKLEFIDTKFLELDSQQLIKAKILFEIYDQKKFYQKLQVPKNNRIKIKNAYLEIEKNFSTDSIKIDKFLLNSNTDSKSIYKSEDLTEKIHSSEVNRLKNWIEIKKFSNQIFSKIN